MLKVNIWKTPEDIENLSLWLTTAVTENYGRYLGLTDKECFFFGTRVAEVIFQYGEKPCDSLNLEEIRRYVNNP